MPSIDLIVPPGGNLFVAEAGLPSGSRPDPDAVYSGFAFNVTAEHGIDDLTVGGIAAIRDGVFTAGSVDTGFGTLSVTAFEPATGKVTVRFQMTQAHESFPGSQQRYGDLISYDVVLTDRMGGEDRADFILQVRDDEALSLAPDAATATAGGAAATGSLVSNDRFTADGFGAVVMLADQTQSRFDSSYDSAGNLSLQGALGVLTVAASGGYSFTANADAADGATERFVYFVEDGDGDRASSTLTVTVQSGPTGGEGQVLRSDQYADILVGGGGADTLIAGRGPDSLTGGGGADTFSYVDLPWNAGHVTDFALGTDRLDLSAIFQAAGYSGTDPVADGRMRFDADGAGGTRLYFDVDALDGGEWPFLITTLDNISPAGLTWAQLLGRGTPPHSPPPDDDGRVIDSPGPGSTLTGGSGSDTLNASQGPDVLTGGGGGDHFAFAQLPWRAGHATDFTPGLDRLDLRALFQASDYAGSDPIADHRLEFRPGDGGTDVYFDPDTPGSGEWPFHIVTLDGVSPSQIGPGDWLWR